MTFKYTKISVIFFLCSFSSHNGFAQDPSSKKVEFPATYTFDYIYKLKMTSQSQKDNVILEYFLKDNADYFGFKKDQMKTEVGDRFFVMDNTLNASAMFMDMMGQKMVQTTSLNMKELTQDAAGYNEESNIKKIGTNTILGYECKAL